MSIRAISLVEPNLLRIMQGELSVLWRNGRQMEGLSVGDLLWVREPFHLERKFNRFAPTVAHERGAKPWYAADLKKAPDPDDWLGRRHPARALPMVWHRQHLRVTWLERRELQSIKAFEAKAQGYSCIAHFSRGWDANVMFERNNHQLWRHNPTVTVFTFDRIEGQVQ